MVTKTVVSVYNIKDGKKMDSVIELPQVFKSPIRPDIVSFVHTNIRKNSRQAHGVFKRAGHQATAESWGTGRAVARIPRVGGGGTGRSGQGAYGNMCRGGHMFAPLRIWRRWHRHVNLKQRRYAICSALAACATTALVMARGHRIEKVPEIPLVLDDSVQNIQKTKEAVAILKLVGAYEDVEKAKDSYHIRAGQGKMRNRRHVMRKGPLVIYNEDHGITKAFRNLPGIDLCCVSKLNLLLLAPGGHMGRFVLWTKSAMEKLSKMYCTVTSPCACKDECKCKLIPNEMITLPDITRIINSEEVKNKIRPMRRIRHVYRKRNALKNGYIMNKLNPYKKIQKKMKNVHKRTKLDTKVRKLRKERKANFVKAMMAEEK